MQNKKSDIVILRCYAYKGKNAGQEGYYAICVDLSLSTWRPSFQAARTSLNQAIYGYIETRVQNATPEQCKNFKKLISRPAPIFPFWTKYCLIKMLEIRKNKNKPHKVYKKPINQNLFCAA